MFVKYCKTIQQTGIGKPIMQCDFCELISVMDGLRGVVRL